MVKIQVFDELNNSWRIVGGQPGMKLISKLTKANYRLIVLPITSLVSGMVTEPTVWPEDVILRTRMQDCLLLLRGD